MNSDVDTDIKDGAENDPSSHPVKYVAELCVLIVLGLVVLVVMGKYIENPPEGAKSVKAVGGDVRK